MQGKTKNKIITIGFSIILGIIFLINIISKDKLISEAERRKLAQKPEITMENIKNGKASKEIDKYLTDQFIAREALREIKSVVSLDILKQQDNNNLFEKDGMIYKMDYPLNKQNLQKSLYQMKKVYNKYLQEMNTYYVIVPEKNYYLRDDDHLKMDYQELMQITKQELQEMKYIDIWDILTLEDYYKTDLHWKQENLQKIVNTIQNNMNIKLTSRSKLQNRRQRQFLWNILRSTSKKNKTR